MLPDRPRRRSTPRFKKGQQAAALKRLRKRMPE
jgi:hypothetical protein